MIRLNRKKILTRFESVRDGLRQAHMAFAEHGDKIAMSCMRAHHGNVNRAIEDLGGKAIELPDLESYLENNPPQMDALIQELKKMRQALHDAINRPMGIVPESAERFYDQSYYDLPNNQK